jgi:signal transduction histidine kinase
VGRLRPDSLDPRLADALLAVGLGGWYVLEMLAAPEHLDGSSVLNSLVGASIAVPLAFRRAAPLRAAAAFYLIAVLQTVFLYDLTTTTSGFLAMVVVIYTVAMCAAKPVRTRALALLLAGGWALAIASEPDRIAQSLIWPLALIVPVWLTARALESRAELNRELAERSRRLEDERNERTRLAVVSERTRIARELHEIVSTEVNAMVVQAQLAERIAESDSQGARGAFAAVEDTGREALAEMRRMLGILRQPGQALDYAPQPTMAGLGALTEHMRERGLAVELGVEGDVVALPSAIDLTAYRVLHDGMEGALQGGRRRVSVMVRYQPDTLEIELIGDPATLRGAVAGLGSDDTDGLVGVRERLAVFGGELRLRAMRDGRTVLLATLPLERVPA